MLDRLRHTRPDHRQTTMLRCARPFSARPIPSGSLALAGLYRLFGLFRPAGLLVLFLLTGCNGLYQVTFNDRLVFDPVGSGDPRADSPFDDPDLGGCVNELLNRSEDRELENITLLACSSADISSLYGIYSLASLQQLELSDNSITDLSPLAELDDLRVLSIRNNDIRDIRPLLELPLLRFVSLQGNPDIPCRQLDQLAQRIGDGLGRPATCAS